MMFIKLQFVQIQKQYVSFSTFSVYKYNKLYFNFVCVINFVILACPKDGEGNICSGKGACDEGLQGSGACTCNTGITGSMCESCIDRDVYGENCEKSSLVIMYSLLI